MRTRRSSHVISALIAVFVVGAASCTREPGAADSVSSPAGDIKEPVRWEAIGPYVADVRHLAVDPHDPDTVYAAGTGMLKSSDAGRTWTRVKPETGDSRAEVNGIIIDPEAPENVYVGSNQGIFTTTDGGRTWKPVSEDFHVSGSFARAAGKGGTFYAAGRQNLCSSQDGGRTWAKAEVFLEYISAITADAQDTDLLLVGGGRKLWITADGGKTWSGSLVNPERPGLIRAAAVNPAFPSVLYAGTALYGKAHGDLCRSGDKGKTWSKVTLLPEAEALKRSLQVYSIAVTPTKPSLVLVGTTAGLFVGRDDGTEIRFDGDPKLPHRRISDLAVVPHVKRIYAATDNGVYVSGDLGQSWSVSFAGFRQPSIKRIAALPGPNVGLLALAPGTLYGQRTGGRWEKLKRNVHQLAIGGKDNGAGFSGDKLFALENRSLVVSKDQGKTWRRVELGKDITVMDLTFSDGKLFVLGLDGTLLASKDEGVTWTDISVKLGHPYQAVEIRIDPNDPSRIYLGVRPGGLWHVLAGGRPPERGAKIAVLLKLGRTLDGGKTWLDLPKQGGEVSFDAGYAELVAGSGAPGKVLYAATFQGYPVAPASVARSIDGGKTWEAFDNQSDLGGITALSVDPKNMRVVYAGGRSGRVYVSHDAAENWDPLGEELDCGRVNDILIRPRGENVIYIATDRGVYRRRLGQ